MIADINELAKIQERMEKEIEEAVVSYLLQETPDCEENLTEWFRVEPHLTAEIFGNRCSMPTEEPPDEF